MTSLLLLDNDEQIIELLSWFLTSRGFDVRIASTFEEARTEIANRAPDLFVSDVDLGAESALDQLPRMSAGGTLPPTLVVSGFLDAGVRDAIVSVPEVRATLAKPFEFPELEAKIRECLGGEPPPIERSAECDQPANVDPRATTSNGSTEEAEDDDGWIEIHPGGSQSPPVGKISPP